MSYKGKVVIVTGAGRGLGSSIAKTYAAKGAKFVLAEKVRSLGLDTEKSILSAVLQPLLNGTNITVDGGMTRKMIYL